MLRQQKVSAVLHYPPFESPSVSCTKESETSIRSVTSIGCVERQQQHSSTTTHTMQDECEGTVAAAAASKPDSSFRDGTSQMQLSSSEFQTHLNNSASTFSNTRQSSLSLRDMYEGEYDDCATSIRSIDCSSVRSQQHQQQLFDMSPEAKHHLPFGGDRMELGCLTEQGGRVREPPVSTNLAVPSTSSSNVLHSTFPANLDEEEEDLTPTPPVSSPATSSLGSVNGAELLKQQLSSYYYMSNNKNQQQNVKGPVLYSAIGSLEDPTTAHSFSRRYIERKVEFPSCLAPQKPQKQTPTKSIKKPSPKDLLKKERKKETQDLLKKEAANNIAAPSSSSEHLKPSFSRQKKSPSSSSSGKQQDAVGLEDDDQPTKQQKNSKPSNLKKSSKDDPTSDSSSKKTVTIAAESSRPPSNGRAKSRRKKGGGPEEMFRPSSDAYTPRMGKKLIKYKDPEMRTPVASMASPLGTLQRPNFRDALRRVAMILHQHVVKIEQRFENQTILSSHEGLFRSSMREVFSEEQFATPTYRCTMVRVPMARPGMVYGLRRLRQKYEIPSEGEIYEFAHRLFKSVQLSSECSIVCLIYVERLMETAKVPLLADTWRPIFMCGLLLASKVWQDLSSWNIEFASVYPQYSLDSINRLELLFLRNVKWDLYISSSCYAKYYFALRSLVEKQDFRQRYNRMVGGVDSVQASEALKIEKRSSMVKEEALSQLSRSM